jgi:hypothetical protein
MPRAPLSAALVAAAGLAASGCATSQRVSLECVPKDVLIYVDGRLLEGSPKLVKLAKDEPHTVLFKGGRYQPQMVVFESRERDGEAVLEPDDLCSRVAFVEMQPEVKIEVEPEAPRAPSR